jgi:hypothetical protein
VKRFVTSGDFRAVCLSRPAVWLATCWLAQALYAQVGFTNSGTLSVLLFGTNVAIGYSMTTTQGWVTLLSADGIGSLTTNSQFVDAAPVPTSRQGAFLVPLARGAPARFYKLLLEPWPSHLFNYPDLSDIIPVGQISIAGSGTNRMFQYTHDTFNGGTGPLEIQPVYNPASGNYQGYQHIYFYQSGTWTLVKTIPVAGAFVFDVAHGHFHFPFASYGLYAANPDGTIGAPVALSTKTGFCIADSFIYDPSLPNAGAFGNWGSCNDPTSLRGLSIGAVDEYDQTDEGQAIPIGNLSDGHYWLRSVVDPYDYLAEGNETNNETDVEVAISGSSVQVLRSVQPVLSLPPKIWLSSPNAGSVTGVVTLAASTPVAGGSAVQFLVDGLPFGNAVAGPVYSLPWDTGTVPNGTHWLAARVADATGHFGTAPVVFVTVTNQSTSPPTVQLTSPARGATVSAVITVSANAAAAVGVPSVQFSVDGLRSGAPVAVPPFVTLWDTETVAAGPHTLTASATDQGGLTSTSAPVVVTVDNSHPAKLIGIDVAVYQDSADVMQTPAFWTTTSSDLLVAFVGYDGPDNSPQTATVTGAGLTWQLAKRSNAQNGTAEIWVAKATDFLTSVTVSSQPGAGGYHGSLSVLAFTNAAGPGIVGQASAPSGAPDIYLPGVFAGNWVFAVGNDWDNALGRTPVGGQVLVHQRLDASTGDTYWVQSTAAPSVADALVDIHDTAPVTDRWNYAAVEIVATRP